MDFVAIDFETANELNASACQLGAVVVESSKVVAEHCWWIRPRPLRFSPHNVAVHGITLDRVRNEPEFGVIWEAIWKVVAGRVVVAHNAGFDIGVLRACLIESNLAIPDLEFTCTRSVARHAWPNHSGFGLRAIADRLGIVFRHHDALEDSRACARVLLAAAEKCNEKSLTALESRLRICRGHAGAWGMVSPRRSDSRRTQRASRWSSRHGQSRRSATANMVQQYISWDSPHAYEYLAAGQASSGSSVQTASRLQQWQDKAQEIRAFTDQTIVFTGHLQELERDEAEELVRSSGGKVTSTVSRKTSILVVGKPDARTFRAKRSVSTKEERARQLRTEGCTIRIIDEETWLSDLLGGQHDQ